MSSPPLIKEKERDQNEWNRKARDAINGLIRFCRGGGPTAARPVNPTKGQTYYDEDLNRPVWWNGAAWQDAVTIPTPPSPAPVTKTANFAVADADLDLINNKSGSSCTVTLPTASSWTGRSLSFKNLQAQTLISASSNVAPIGSATLGTAILPATVGAWCTLKSDGSNWVILRRGT
ncbi:MAG: hypothetical protein V4618_13490 [Pseudomonadota bacterium]